jgi:transcriptional regulator with XRE-family HTH domain
MQDKTYHRSTPTAAMTSDASMNGIGPRIKYFAKRCYRTQNNFCEETGIDATQLSNYISKGRMPGGEVLFRFNTAGMSLDWLFNGGEDEKMYADNPAGERLRQERAEFKRTMNNVNLLPREAHEDIAETKVIKIDDYQNHLAMLQNFITFMRESAK